MSKVEIQVPPSWRKGQTLFNFLEWLLQTGRAPANQNARLADTFHLDDEEFDKYYREWLKENNNE